MNKYEDLVIWKKAMDLTERVYRLSTCLPIEEKYGLKSQLLRAAVSIPANIAEGAGRNSNREFVRFLGIANGSTCEVETLLHLTFNLSMVNDREKIDNILDLSLEVKKMNYALQKSLK